MTFEAKLKKAKLNKLKILFRIYQISKHISSFCFFLKKTTFT